MGCEQTCQLDAEFRRGSEKPIFDQKFQTVHAQSLAKVHHQFSAIEHFPRCAWRAARPLRAARGDQRGPAASGRSTRVPGRPREARTARHRARGARHLALKARPLMPGPTISTTLITAHALFRWACARRHVRGCFGGLQAPREAAEPAGLPPRSQRARRRRCAGRQHFALPAAAVATAATIGGPRARGAGWGARPHAAPPWGDRAGRVDVRRASVATCRARSAAKHVPAGPPPRAVSGGPHLGPGGGPHGAPAACLRAARTRATASTTDTTRVASAVRLARVARPSRRGEGAPRCTGSCGAAGAGCASAVLAPGQQRRHGAAQERAVVAAPSGTADVAKGGRPAPGRLVLCTWPLVLLNNEVAGRIPAAAAAGGPACTGVRCGCGGAVGRVPPRGVG